MLPDSKVVKVGAELADTEVIQSSSRTRELYMNLLKSAAKEVFWYLRLAELLYVKKKMGVIQMCKEAARDYLRISVLAFTESSSVNVLSLVTSLLKNRSMIQSTVTLNFFSVVGRIPK